MNRDLLELYTDYLLSAFSYTTATGLSAIRLWMLKVVSE